MWARCINNSTVPCETTSPAAQGQLGVHPAGAVGAARGDVHLADHVGQQRVADLAGRRSAAAVLVVARLRDIEDAGGHLHRQAFPGLWVPETSHAAADLVLHCCCRHGMIRAWR